MATVSVLTIMLTCFSAITATYHHNKDHNRPKVSPLGEDEPIVLHAARPLLITRTIQELPEEKVRPLIRIFVPRPSSKILKLHDLRNIEHAKIKQIYPRYGYIQPSQQLHVQPKRIILTEPIILDHGYGSLHNEVLHDEKLINGLHVPHRNINPQPLVNLFPPYPTLLHPLPQKYPLILQEKQVLRPFIPIYPLPLKSIKPGY